jgi:hypothetical protein
MLTPPKPSIFISAIFQGPGIYGLLNIRRCRIANPGGRRCKTIDKGLR